MTPEEIKAKCKADLMNKENWKFKLYWYLSKIPIIGKYFYKKIPPVSYNFWYAAVILDGPEKEGNKYKF